MNEKAKSVVQTARFDSWGMPIPDLLVMDVEGSESLVLRGFGEKLKDLKYVCFETGFSSAYETKENFHYLHRLMRANGFRYIASNQSGIGMTNLRLMKIRNMLYRVRTRGLLPFAIIPDSSTLHMLIRKRCKRR